MAYQIYIGLYTEGVTDTRFLVSVVERTFLDISYGLAGDFEFYVIPICIEKSRLNFREQVLRASRKGHDDHGISILCLHKDADDRDSTNVLTASIDPALDTLFENKEECCTLVSLAIPVYMIEAWLLADKELFKKAIGTTKSDVELAINADPETISNPKDRISEAIRIAQIGLSKKRKTLTLGELYMPLGEQISIDDLKRLDSFLSFHGSVVDCFRELNLYHPL